MRGFRIIKYKNIVMYSMSNIKPRMYTKRYNAIVDIFVFSEKNLDIV